MAKSAFQYIEPTQLPQYIHTMSGVTDEALAAKFITEAEQIVDAYVGHGPRFYTECTGTVEVLMPSGTVLLSGSAFGDQRDNYWAQGGVYVEVYGSTEATLVGQSRLVVASAAGSQVSLVSGFAVDVPVGTQFVYRQRSRFPRLWNINTLGDPRLPDELALAVAYQVEYGIIEGSEEFGLGDSLIANDPKAGVSSRNYGTGYSEVRSAIQAMAKFGMAVWIAPKARTVLRNHLNTTGRL